MEPIKASRPKKARKKPLPKVSRPESLIDEKEIAKPTPFTSRANIGKDPDLVETVGLGNLKVITAQGIKNDGNTKL